MPNRSIVGLTCALAIVAGLAACDSDSDSPGRAVPTGPPGPSLAGRILILDESDRTLAEVSAGGDGVTAKVLFGDTVEASVSPDGRTLARITAGGDLNLHDLVGNSAPRLVTPHGDAGRTLLARPGCLSWAPDSQHLAFLARTGGALYVTSFDGTATKIDEPKSEDYYETDGTMLPRPGLPGLRPTGRPTTVSSTVTCGQWLDAQRLLFDRVATMPNSVKITEGKPTPVVAADTSTVARLGTKVTLTDSATRWSILDSCAGSLLVRPVGDGPEQRFLVRAADVTDQDAGRDATAAARQLPATPGRRFGADFIPGSCDLLMISQGDGSGFHPAQRRSAATGTAQELAPVFDDDHSPPLNLETDTIVWGPGADPTVYVNDGAGSRLLELHDLNTGGMTDVRLADTGQSVDRVIGWLP